MGGLEALQVAQSYHSWWQLAGVDTLVAEEPADWLSKRAPASAPEAEPAPQFTPVEPVAASLVLDRPAPQPVVAPLATPMPDEWDAFQAWLASEPGVPGSQWDQRRVLPSGAVSAPLMVLTSCPEIDEQSAGELFAGPPGQLLDAMLRAVGLTRAQCYCASLAVTRPPGGRLDADARSALTPLLWHHLALARPQKLLLLGNEVTSLVAESDVASARGNLLNVNQDGVNMSAVAILHPALLLARPALKVAAWDSLKLLNKGR